MLLDRQPRRRRRGRGARAGARLRTPRRSGRSGVPRCCSVCCSPASGRSHRSLPYAPASTAPADSIPSVTWLLAAMAVCFGLTEGTGIDWSSLHVTEVGQVSPSAGAWGLACVAGFMVVIRLAGDAVVERLGRALVVRLGAAVALCGYLLTAFTGDLWIDPARLVPGRSWRRSRRTPDLRLAGHVGGGRGLALWSSASGTPPSWSAPRSSGSSPRSRACSARCSCRWSRRSVWW